MKKPILLAISIMLISVLVACSSTSESEISSEPNTSYALNFTPSKSDLMSLESESENADDGGRYTDYNPVKKVNPVNIFKTDEPIVYGNISISGLKMTITKERPKDIVASEFNYLDNKEDKRDQSGKLTGDSSYVFLNFDISNTSSTTEDVYLNSIFEFALLDKNYSYEIGIGNARYRDGNVDIADKSYFRQVLDANSTLNCTVGYILYDDVIHKDNLYLVLQPFADNEEYKAYKMN